MTEFDVTRIFTNDVDAGELEAYYAELLREDQPLVFNGINGATGEYGVAPMSGKALLGAIKDTPKPANLGELKGKQTAAFPIKPPNDPTDLAQAGWAVIFPAKGDPAVKEALTELLKLREEQAGERFRVLEGAAGYRPGESKADFFRRHRVGEGPADPVQLPYYVLLVGSPEEIPYEFQYQLDVMRGVGRIHFDTLQEYANYARGVAVVERGEVRLPRQAGFFGVTNPGDRATELSSQYLMRPLVNQLKAQQPIERWVRQGNTKAQELLDWQFDLYMAEQTTKAQLQRLLGGDQTPALLFTASHGMEFPMGDRRQIPHQGALLCQNWPGPQQWRGDIPQDFYFAGDDLTAETRLQGLIAFFFACFGAGTPHLDQFAKQAHKTEREQIAPHNFLGALPQSILSHGGLAVLGHVERAWGYSFISPGAGAQTGVFEGTLLQLLRGDPVGWVTENLNMKYADLATELVNDLEELEWDENYINPYDLAQKWTAHNDARNYVIIGDPAARIPFARPDETPLKRPDLGVISAAVESAVSQEAAATHTEAELQDEFRDVPFATDAALEFSTRAQFNSLQNSVNTFVNQLGAALQAAARDLTTLTVETYTTDDLPAASRGDESQARLRALTHIDFDGDMKVFVPEAREGGVDTALWDIHLQMVKEAQANRAQFLQAVAEMATNLLGSLTP